MTILTSSCSKYPCPTYSPSALPHELKSNVHSPKPALINLPKYSILYIKTNTLQPYYHLSHADKGGSCFDQIR